MGRRAREVGGRNQGVLQKPRSGSKPQELGEASDDPPSLPQEEPALQTP